MSGTPTNVLFVSSRGDATGGGEGYLLLLMRHLDRARFTPMVVLPFNGTLRPALERLGVEVTVVGMKYGRLGLAKPWYQWLAELPERVRTLTSLIHERDIRLVHTNSNHRWEGAIAAALAGIHHLYLAHIEFQPEMPIFERLALQQASFAQIMGELSTRIVAVSDAVARTLSPPVSPEKVRVIHNGLDLDVFDAARASNARPLRQALGVPADATLVIAVGRLHPDKGFDDYVSAAAKVLAKFPDVHFCLVGGDTATEVTADLKAQIRDAGIGARFHCLGRREDVPHLLAASDIFVLSSRREGHPYVLLEAMACGCATVATRCHGADETCVENVTGYLINIGDVSAMAEAIGRLCENTELRKRIGAAGVEYVRTRFRVQDSVAALMTQYAEIVACPRPMAGSPALELIIQGAGELGAMGLRMIELEERLNHVEQFVSFRENPFATGLRRAFRILRSGVRSKP